MCQRGNSDIGGFHSSYIGMNVCYYACKNGCVANGAHAKAAD